MRQAVSAGKEQGAASHEAGARASLARSRRGMDGSIVGLQQSAGNRAVLSLLSSPRVQTKSNCNCSGHDSYETEADRAAEAVVSGGLAPRLSGAPSGDDEIQRKCASCEEEEREQNSPSPDSDPGGGGATPASAAAATAESPEGTEPEAALEQAASEEPGAAPAPGLIVDEAAADAPPDAMRKPEFLSALRQSVCSTVDAGSAGTGESSAGCPWIAHWFDYYEGKSARHLERALLKYAPEARGATSAYDYIAAVTARVRQSVAVWRETGEVTGLPEGMSPELPGGILGGVFSAVGGLFFKARRGGAKTADPAAVRGRLGGGRSLDGSVRTRMESAFGVGFSGVRVHTDATAGRLSNDMNARAFTLGRDVAFGSGEYRPGTPAGDALIAHELAHVVQQGAGESAPPQAKGVNPATGSLEIDADNAAVAATASLWGRAVTGLQGFTTNAMPRLRSGLQLQRCAKTTKAECLPPKCEQPVKTVSVDLIKLHGSNMTPATDLSVAKTAYAPCCINVVAGKQETVSEADTKSWLGNDTILEQTDSCSPTTEESDVLLNSTAKYSLSGRFQAFYIEDSTHDARANSCRVSGDYGKSVWVTNSAKPRSLAHEIGHVLIDTSAHKGICDTEAKDNIMTPTNDASGQVIDKDQCEKAYGNV